ncbi:MAG: sensor histidine kinase [Stappiaceae bacterium]|uniref:sensor histidine kinase n=1 Tax=Roseibium sp. TaxID=1936156 RepID=UPI0032978B59
MDTFHRLLEELSSEDRERSAVKHRRQILDALNNFVDTIEPGTPCLTLLWLFDRNNHNAVHDCTLWNCGAVNWTHDVLPEHLFNVTQRFRGRDTIDAIVEAERSISMNGHLFADTGLFKHTSPELKQRLDECIIRLEPHCSKDREDRFVGFLQIVTTTEVLSQFQPLYKTIIGKLVFNRIAFGRRQRTIDALKKFQEQIRPEMEYDAIIDAATKCLEEYLTLERICVYDHKYDNDGINGVKKRDQTGPDTRKLPEITKWIKRYFLSESKNGSSTGVIRVRDFFKSEEENIIFKPSLEGHDASWQPPDCAPIGVMMIPVYVGDRNNPPIATIKVTCTAVEDFIGGTFSETDEQIGKILSDYLRHLLPGVITYSRTQEISRHLDEHDASALLPGEIHNRIYDVFPELITKLLVNVNTAWAYVRTKEVSGEIKVRWVSQTGTLEKNPIDLDDETLEEVPDKPFRLESAHYLHGVKVIEADETLRLYWISNRPKVPDHDMLLIKQLASDMRLRAFGRLDVQTLSRQIIDMRHAVKAAMTGVVGFTDQIADIYDDVKNEPPAERDNEIFNRAEFRKAIEGLKLSAETTTRFLNVVRILKMDLRSDDLKPRHSNPNEIARRIIRTIRPYSTRRGLTVNLVEKYPSSVVNPFFDPDLMEIAMSNLIENGVKYARRGTNISVMIGTIRDQWYFYVEDEGRWIPGEDRERIFTGMRLQAFSGETGQAGTGLGLAAVRRIVKAHDPRGKDEVSSVKTGGGDINAPTAITRIGFRLRRANLVGAN